LNSSALDAANIFREKRVFPILLARGTGRSSHNASLTSRLVSALNGGEMAVGVLLDNSGCAHLRRAGQQTGYLISQLAGPSIKPQRPSRAFQVSRTPHHWRRIAFNFSPELPHPTDLPSSLRRQLRANSVVHDSKIWGSACPR
jgi:hypothetical protein